MFSEVLDEMEPEDPLNEVDSATLSAPRKRGQFPYDQCEMVCRNQFLLSRDRRARHETKTSSEGSSRCNHCGKVFGSAASCKHHIAQCQKSQVCDFSAFWKIFYLTFIPQHYWQMPIVPMPKGKGGNCEQPSISSTSPPRSRLRSANLSDALDNCSLAPSSFLCDQCKKSFVNEKNLVRHYVKFHKG